LREQNHYKEQGWSKCTVVGTLLVWGKMTESVCDYWKAKPVLTERDKVIRELSHRQKKALGLV